MGHSSIIFQRLEEINDLVEAHRGRLLGGIGGRQWGDVLDACFLEVVEVYSENVKQAETASKSGSSQEMVYQVWREDDNGFRMMVGEFSSCLDAEKKIRDLEKGGHKQLYWVQGCWR